MDADWSTKDSGMVASDMATELCVGRSHPGELYGFTSATGERISGAGRGNSSIRTDPSTSDSGWRTSEADTAFSGRLTEASTSGNGSWIGSMVVEFSLRVSGL